MTDADKGLWVNCSIPEFCNAVVSRLGVARDGTRSSRDRSRDVRGGV